MPDNGDRDRLKRLVVCIGLVACRARPIEVLGLDCADAAHGWQTKWRAELGVVYRETDFAHPGPVESRISDLETMVVKHCTDEWPLELQACRAGAPCKTDLTPAQRASLLADLASVIPGMGPRKPGDACAAAIDASIWRGTKGEALTRMLFLQAVTTHARDTLVTRCTADAWPAAVVQCFAAATEPAASNACAIQLDPELQRKADDALWADFKAATPTSQAQFTLFGRP